MEGTLICVSFVGVLGTSTMAGCVVLAVMGSVPLTGTTTGGYVFPGCKSLPFALFYVSLSEP